MNTPRQVQCAFPPRARLLPAIVVIGACTPLGPDPDEPFEILADGRLQSNFDLAVESKHGKLARHDWVRSGCGRLSLCYPDEQDSGSVKFLLGLDDKDARLIEDFTAFDRLQVELRGDWAALEVGLTAWTHENGMDHQGRLCRLRASREWTTVTIPLDYLDPTFDKGNRRYWAPLEVYTDSNRALTIELRAARLLPESQLSVDEIRCPADCECDSLECQSMCGLGAGSVDCSGAECESSALSDTTANQDGQ
jgi:hypothetical protein